MPEEFAAAYREAYERALAGQTTGPRHAQDTEPDEGDSSDTRGEMPALPRRRGRLRIGTHRSEAAYDDTTPGGFDRLRDSAWFVPLLLALLATVLILGAYFLGKRFAEQVQSGTSGTPSPTVVTKDPDAPPIEVTNQKPGGGAWDGAVVPVTGVRATAGCTSKSGVDASGASVSYQVGNLVDGRAETTWRCDGAAVGEKITLDLGTDVAIGEVGLIPGYAKTDDETKADRYAENNRITRVRWTIGDTVVVQRMKGTAKDRSLRLVRVPRTSTDEVVLEILRVKKGPRDTTAISEIQLGRAD